MKPFVLYFTGLSGSGKTTLAVELERALRARDVPVQVLDGDVLREEFGNLFGYTKEERMKQGRVGWVLTRYLNRNGIAVIVAAVVPYDEIRKSARAFLGESYIQVYLDCPVEECARRDVKGYYSQARPMENLNGVSAGYEVPRDSEIVVDTVRLGVRESAEKILDYLTEHGFLE